MALAQSAIVGWLAGEVSGAVCKAVNADKDVKKVVQAASCIMSGGICAVFTVDPLGGLIVVGETLMYAYGQDPSAILYPLGLLLESFKSSNSAKYS
jgi:hypothetical protein